MMTPITENDLFNDPAATLAVKGFSNVVVTRSGMVISPRGVEKDSLFSFFNTKDLLKSNLIGVGSLLRNSISFLEDRDYYSVLNVWASSYHHWMTEVALKLVLFEEELKRGRILIPQRSPGFIKETLSILGFGNVEFYRGNVFVRRLKIITNPVSGHYYPEHILTMSDRFLEAVPLGEQGFPKIYVSRENARARRVINEDEVKDLLKGLGFVCVELDNVSLTEQIKMFRTCRVLVSIHGAALTNSIFMPRGSQVIEFYSLGFTRHDYFNGCYYRLNKVVGNRHEYLFCEREHPSKPYFIDDNIIVDVERLKEVLIPAVENI